MLTLQDIEAAARVVYQQFQATPQYRWALSSERLLDKTRKPHTRRRLQNSRRVDVF